MKEVRPGRVLSKCIARQCVLARTPPEFDVVTAEFKINFLRPAFGDHFLAMGTVIKAGNRCSTAQ
jgi:acyl-coenzyme A thioesterase PaaI-like protein